MHRGKNYMDYWAVIKACVYLYSFTERTLLLIASYDYVIAKLQN